MFLDYALIFSSLYPIGILCSRIMWVVIEIDFGLGHFRTIDVIRLCPNHYSARFLLAGALVYSLGCLSCLCESFYFLLALLNPLQCLYAH